MAKTKKTPIAELETTTNTLIGEMFKATFMGKVKRTATLLKIWKKLNGKKEVKDALEYSPIKLKNDFGSSLAHSPATFNHPRVITELHKAGVKLDEKNDAGFTPADLARTAGHETLAKKIDTFVDETATATSLKYEKAAKKALPHIRQTLDKLSL